MLGSCIALLALGGALMLVPIVVLLNPVVSPHGRTTSAAGADAALKHIGEFAKWMALIETAAIGGLGTIFFKDNCELGVNAWGIRAFVLLGLALFVSAWLLSALPSLAERLDLQAESPLSDDVLRASPARYNVSAMPLYDWFSRSSLRRFDVSVMLALAHWYWALGLVCVALAVGHELK